MGQISSRCCPCRCPCRRKRGRALLSDTQADPKSTTLTRAPRAGTCPTKAYPSTSHGLHTTHPRKSLVNIDQVVRLVLIGSCNTGKTCLLRRFLGGYYDDTDVMDYTRTLGVDFGCKTVELADRRVRLQMWDTGGSESYRSVLSHYLRSADGVVMCFDVNQRASLRDLRIVWAPFMDEHGSKMCRLLLVGNKAEPRERGDRAREVGCEQAKRFADAIGARVFETSARHGTNVDLAIMTLIREVLEAREKDADSSTSAEDGRSKLGLVEALRKGLEGDSGDGLSSPSETARGRSGSRGFELQANPVEDQAYAIDRGVLHSAPRFALRSPSSHPSVDSEANRARGASESDHCSEGDYEPWRWVSASSPTTGNQVDMPEVSGESAPDGGHSRGDGRHSNHGNNEATSGSSADFETSTNPRAWSEGGVSSQSTSTTSNSLTSVTTADTATAVAAKAATAGTTEANIRRLAITTGSAGPSSMAPTRAPGALPLPATALSKTVATHGAASAPMKSLRSKKEQKRPVQSDGSDESAIRGLQPAPVAAISTEATQVESVALGTSTLLDDSRAMARAKESARFLQDGDDATAAGRARGTRFPSTLLRDEREAQGLSPSGVLPRRGEGQGKRKKNKGRGGVGRHNATRQSRINRLDALHDDDRPFNSNSSGSSRSSAHSTAALSASTSTSRRSSLGDP